jgi:arginase
LDPSTNGLVATATSHFEAVTRLAILDAPIDSSGEGRGEENAPAALRAAGLLERLRADDAGAADARIRDSKRDPDTGVIGVEDVRRASTAVASHLGPLLDEDLLPLVVGGDCTLLLGVFRAVAAGTGLWFVDGHADFYDGESSPTGEAADMELSALTGHGPNSLLNGDPPLDPSAVVLLGHRPDDVSSEVASENARLDPSIHALTAPEVQARGPEAAGVEAAASLAEPPAWLHVDLDALDQSALPAVSYPQPRGLGWAELRELVAPLAAAPNLIGVSVADFNPDRDPDGRHARAIVEALADLFG